MSTENNNNFNELDNWWQGECRKNLYEFISNDIKQMLMDMQHEDYKVRAKAVKRFYAEAKQIVITTLNEIEYAESKETNYKEYIEELSQARTLQTPIDAAIHRLQNGLQWSSEHGEWILEVHHTLTEPVCASANIRYEKLQTTRYSAFGETVAEAILKACEMCIIEQLDHKPIDPVSPITNPDDYLDWIGVDQAKVTVEKPYQSLTAQMLKNIAKYHPNFRIVLPNGEDIDPKFFYAEVEQTLRRLKWAEEDAQIANEHLQSVKHQLFKLRYDIDPYRGFNRPQMGTEEQAISKKLFEDGFNLGDTPEE
jgi:hypothetical protein